MFQQIQQQLPVIIAVMAVIVAAVLLFALGIEHTRRRYDNFLSVTTLKMNVRVAYDCGKLDARLEAAAQKPTGLPEQLLEMPHC